MKTKKILCRISAFSAALLAGHFAALAIYWSVGQILLIIVAESDREFVNFVFVISLLINLAVFCISTQWYRALQTDSK